MATPSARGARHRTLLVLVGVLSTGVALAAGPASATPTAPAKPAATSGVTLSVGDQLGGIKAGLAAAGLLNGLPYSVDWHVFQSGPPLVEALNAGSIDVGLVGDVPPVFAAASHVDLKVIGAVQTDPAGANALLVPSGSPIKTLADLKGKNLAYGEGTSAQYFVVQLLKRAKLSLKDIQPVNLATVDARAAGISGRVDAWVSSDPLITLDVTTHAARVLQDGTGLTTGLVLYVARGEAIQSKHAALADFINRIAQSRIWARQHPTDWATTWASQIGLPVAVLTAVAQNGKYTPVPINATVVGAIQRIANSFAAAGLIPRKVNVKTVFNPTFNAVLGTPITQ